MANEIFFLRGQLGRVAALAIGNEQRIVTEPAIAPWRCGNGA